MVPFDGVEQGRGVAMNLRNVPGTAFARSLFIAFSLLLATFFAFVGWHKSVDSLADLARYGAWTARLPEWAGRLIGWSEIACAAALIVGLLRLRAGRIAALVLVANQIAAAAVHAAGGEFTALPQNGVLIAMALGVSLISREEKP